MQLPAAALSVNSHSSATTDGMISEDTNSVPSSRPPSVTMQRSSSRSGRRAITPTILDILRENNSTSPSSQNEDTNDSNKRKSNDISLAPPVRRLLVPNTDRPSSSTGTNTKRCMSGTKFSSITPCSSPLKRHRKDTASSSSILHKPKASRQRNKFATTRIGFDFDENDRVSPELDAFKDEEEDEDKEQKKRRKKKKKSINKKHQLLQRVQPHVFTSPGKSSRLVQLRPDMLCESPVEPLSRKHVSPSHKERRLEDENTSTVVLVTRPAKSFDRPWPVRTFFVLAS